MPSRATRDGQVRVESSDKPWSTGEGNGNHFGILALLLLLLSRFNHVRLFTTPWAEAYQALLSMGFSRQEYWSGLPLPSLILALRTP